MCLVHDGFLLLWVLVSLLLLTSQVGVCKAEESSSTTVPVTIAVKFDRYPDETSWILTCNDIVYAQEQQENNNLKYQLVMETHFIPQGSTCNFTITDDYGDGICCRSGQGYYQVLLGEVDKETQVAFPTLQQNSHGLIVVQEGGDFEDMDQVWFVAEFPAPTASPAPSMHPSAQPTLTPTLSIQPSSFPSREPSSRPTTSREPSSYPSEEPTSVPSLSSAPTVPSFPVTIVIQLDSYSDETGWSLVCNDVVYAKFQAPHYKQESHLLIQKTFHVEMGQSCTFSIQDVYGDGLMTSQGGYFGLYWTRDIAGLANGEYGELLVKGGEFGHEFQYQFDAVPLAPTASPIPSMSPSIAPSASPTTSAVPTVFSDCQVNDPLHFNICIDSLISGSFLVDWSQYLADAKERWQSIILQDTTASEGILGLDLQDLNVPICNDLPLVVDDLYICAKDVVYDGPGGVLGQAVITARNENTPQGLPVAGYMEFDSDDIANLLESSQESKLASLILHEMGHLLGIGPLWRSLGLISNLGNYENPDWTYVGEHACSEWQALTNCSACPPLESYNTAGFVPAHFDEATMDHELMTGFAEPNGTPNALSRITIASLLDLGYVVDYNQADDYSLDNLTCPDGDTRNRFLRRRRVSTKHPPLSEQGTRAAQRFGKKLLAQGKRRKEQATLGRPGGLVFTADEHVSVMYQENDRIYFVDVYA